MVWNGSCKIKHNFYNASILPTLKLWISKWLCLLHSVSMFWSHSDVHSLTTQSLLWVAMKAGQHFVCLSHCAMDCPEVLRNFRNSDTHALSPDFQKSFKGFGSKLNWLQSAALHCWDYITILPSRWPSRWWSLWKTYTIYTSAMNSAMSQYNR